MSEGLKTLEPNQSTALKPYLDPSWDSMGENTKSAIIRALLEEPGSTLRVIHNDAKERVIFCENSGVVISDKPYSRKINNMQFKSEHELWNLTKPHLVQEYFRTYQNTKIFYGEDCIKLMSGCTESQLEYLACVVSKLIAKNIAMVSTSELRAAVGANSYRKAKQVLIEKNLIRDCSNKLPRAWSLLQINPGIALKGNPSSYRYDSLIKWSQQQ